MTEPDSGSFTGSSYTVTDPVQARLLTEPVSKEFFKPFLAHERSASEAAEILKASLNTTLYRVKTLLKAGLLEVVREVPRKGRSIKIYRSAHDAYFIPFNVTPYATLEERLWVQAKPLFSELVGAYAAALRTNERYGHHVFVGENGAVWTSDKLPALTPTGLPVVYSDMPAYLEDEDARTIGRDLQDVFGRGLKLGAKANRKGNSHTYICMVALLPLEKL